ncbi:MAG: selenocysteine-specific translation elongation factor, partial [Gemmatimonadetes bacterium]|nr:selenocysteine-specific translation elongation factor [Gemmatimonadota bacterium]
IDHGKTTLVRALTGVDTDRLPEEQRRGITIELGFAPLDLPGVGRVGVVDVPGHEGFVRTMVAGATGVDVGLLVIAADEGVMPQTREHLAILRLLEVRALVVALTKCDLVDADWMELVREDVRGLLAATPYASAPVIPVSARTSEGLDELRAALGAAVAAGRRRDEADLFRLPIDRVFTVRGTGTVVTGTSWSGAVQVGAELRLLPGDTVVRVRGIQAHGAAVERAGPGARLAIALTGVELADVHRGMTIASPAPWVATTHFHAEVTAVDPDAGYRPREWLRLHVGTAEVSARVVTVGGGTAARVVTEEPVVLRAGDRFVLRRSQPLATVGGGIVVDPAPGRARRRPSGGWEAEPAGRLERLLLDAGDVGLAVREIPVRVGCRPNEVAALCADLVTFRERVYPRDLLDAYSQAVESQVLAFLGSHTTEPGAPSAVWGQVKPNEALVELAVEQLVSAGRMVFRGPALAPAGWEPRLDAEQERVAVWLLGQLRAAGREPPSVPELAAHAVGPTPLVPVLRFLERSGSVVAVEPDRFYAREAVNDMVAALVAHMQGAGQAENPATLRGILGVSRKYLMPFLEYCDRERITERRGEGRVLISRGGLA